MNTPKYDLCLFERDCGLSFDDIKRISSMLKPSSNYIPISPVSNDGKRFAYGFISMDFWENIGRKNTFIYDFADAHIFHPDAEIETNGTVMWNQYSCFIERNIPSNVNRMEVIEAINKDIIYVQNLTTMSKVGKERIIDMLNNLHKTIMNMNRPEQE